MKLRHLGVFGAAGLMAVAAIGTPAMASAPRHVTQDATPQPVLHLGIELPLSGGEVANGQPTRNGVLLAIAEANAAGGVGGFQIVDNTQDDAVNGAHNPDQGALNMGTLVADDATFGVVGPFNSSVARSEIPVSNEAGLAQCSPANTGVDLTQDGSEVYRPSHPDVRNYFRVATPDNIQGPAGASIAYTDLGKTKAFVVDDTEAFGKGVADSFSAKFQELGGTIVGRQGNDYKQNQDFSSMLNAVAGQFDVVYFGGTQVTGGGQLRKQMGQAGMLDIPMVGPDGITDLAPGGSQGAFITLAGVENSGNVYGTVAGIHDIPDPEAFATKYKAMFQNADPGAYSALAYACAQVLLQSLDAALKGGADASDPAALREAVRANVFSGATFDTVLGSIFFDANGDTSQKWISFYKTDPTLNDGKGGWSFVKQQNFAEAGPGASPEASGSTAP